MDGIVGLIVLVGLVFFIGGILGWVAFFRLNSLSDSYRRLSADFDKLKRQLSELSKTSQTQPSQEQSPPAMPAKPQASTKGTVEREASQPSPTPNKPDQQPSPRRLVFASSTVPSPASPTEQPKTPSSRNTHEQPSQPSSNWLSSLIDNWMIWLGGISVGLAGIFMVKYSISMGLLGPKTQISLAILTGIILHVVAEWLRRRKGSSDPVFASLAGGASITLYAALLAALHVHHIITPGWAFVFLAIVSLITMGLSLLQGPMLAMLGLVGAYVVPILVSTNSGNMIAALIYSLIITAAALILLRFVFRPWLWWSIIIGSMAWWLISLPAEQADSFRAIYLAILAWSILALPHFDFLVQFKSKGAIKELDDKTIQPFKRAFSMNQVGLFILVIAWAISLLSQGHAWRSFESVASFMLWAPMVAVLIFAAGTRPSLWPLPWLSLILHLMAWITIGFEPIAHGYKFLPLSPEAGQLFLVYAGVMAFVYSALSAWQWYSRGFTHPRASLTLLAPLMWLALAYTQTSALSQSLEWSLVALVFGLVYAAATAWRLKQSSQDHVALWLTLATHFAYSLGAVMYFDEALLSLVIAVQLLSLAWLIKRYELPWLELFLKAMVAIVVLRLTLNPWLADYPTDVHWSLYTYGGSTLLAFLASRQLTHNPQLRAWLEAATLHLLVLTLGTELRYWLYDGDIFVSEYSLTESAINTSLWAALALVYYYRSNLSQNLQKFYVFCSKLLLIVSLASYFISITHNNPWWSGELISNIPIFNILLLAYGAPILLAILVALYHQPQYRSMALRFAGFASLLFITIEIRHLWQGSDIGLSNNTSDGEIYTYSVIWMLMAIPAVLIGARQQIQELYKVGMILLIAVIGKIFLIDMAGLDGLWRVASFMGLGLTLLALAWFNKKLKE